MYRVMAIWTALRNCLKRKPGRPSTPLIEPQQARAAAVELTERGRVYVDSIEDAREVLAVLPRVADDPRNYRVTDLGARFMIAARESHNRNPTRGGYYDVEDTRNTSQGREGPDDGSQQVPRNTKSRPSVVASDVG